MLTSNRLSVAASTTRQGWSPDRKDATALVGRTVADRPIRCGRWLVSRCSRCSESAKWAPRLVPARAWISSTMMVVTGARVWRAREVSIRNSDSGVVIRMSGGDVSRARRARGIRVAGAYADADVRHRLKIDFRQLPKPGQWAAQISLDIHTERLQRRDIEDLGPVSTTVADQLIDCEKESGECLAAAGGSHHQGVLAGRYDRPGCLLRGGGGGEAGCEPGAHEVTEG